MATSRKHPGTTERREPVITYSRVAPRGAPVRPRNGARPMEIERVDPFLTETAVPLAPPPRPRMDPPARMDPVAAPELRAEPFDLDEAVADESDIGVVAKERRPRSAMFLIVGAVVAIAAGIGVLAVSFNAATLATVDTPSASENVSAAVAPPAEPAEDAAAATNDEMIADIEARLAALEGRTIPAHAETVRQVSPSPGETVSAEGQPAATSAPALPPAPRLRPERVATATPAGPADPSPVAPTASGKPAVQAARPAGAGDDDFIANIERALADSRTAPPNAGADPTLEPGLLPQAEDEDGVTLDMLPAPDAPVPPEPIPDVGSGLQ